MDLFPVKSDLWIRKNGYFLPGYLQSCLLPQFYIFSYFLRKTFLITIILLEKNMKCNFRLLYFTQSRSSSFTSFKILYPVC